MQGKHQQRVLKPQSNAQQPQIDNFFKKHHVNYLKKGQASNENSHSSNRKIQTKQQPRSASSQPRDRYIKLEESSHDFLQNPKMDQIQIEAKRNSAVELSKFAQASQKNLQLNQHQQSQSSGQLPFISQANSQQQQLLLQRQKIQNKKNNMHIMKPNPNQNSFHESPISKNMESQNFLQSSYQYNQYLQNSAINNNNYNKNNVGNQSQNFIDNIWPSLPNSPMLINNRQVFKANFNQNSQKVRNLQQRQNRHNKYQQQAIYNQNWSNSNIDKNQEAQQFPNFQQYEQDQNGNNFYHIYHQRNSGPMCSPSILAQLESKNSKKDDQKHQQFFFQDEINQIQGNNNELANSFETDATALFDSNNEAPFVDSYPNPPNTANLKELQQKMIQQKQQSNTQQQQKHQKQPMEVWKEVLSLIKEQNFEKACNIICQYGDDIFFLRFAVIINNSDGFDKLSDKTAKIFIQRYQQLMENCFVEKLCFNFFQEHIDSGCSNYSTQADKEDIINTMQDYSSQKGQIGNAAQNLCSQYKSIVSPI